MKNVFLLLRSYALCALAALTLTTLFSCSKDDEEVQIVNPQVFTGKFTTTIPSMPDFAAIEGTNTAVVTWANNEQTAAAVKLGAFNINVQTPMGAKAYEIGEMIISGIQCSKSGNVITLQQKDFECQAGNFATTGTIVGELQNGLLTLTIIYKPGSMPFMVQSVFVGK